MARIQNIKNQRFNRLVAKEYSHTEKGKSSTWICECDCGNLVEVELSSLRNSNTQSCGCLRLERAAETNTKHQRSKTSEYYAWDNMIQRCRNPKNPQYENYGGRGIDVCEEWVNSFKTFFNDMGKKPNKNLSLDRINNDKGYNKKNCRWTDSYTQASNQRNRRNETTGIKNISYSNRDKLYYVDIRRKDKRYRKGFKELKNAIDWKEKVLSNLTSTTIKREG